MFKDIPKKEIAATFASVGDVNRAAELLLLKKCKILISFCHSSGTYQIQGGQFLAFKDLSSFLLLLYMTLYCFLSILTFKPIQHVATPINTHWRLSATNYHTDALSDVNNWKKLVLSQTQSINQLLVPATTRNEWLFYKQLKLNTKLMVLEVWS